MPRHDRYPGEESFDDEPDRITDEDVMRLLEETFRENQFIETDVPKRDITAVRTFMEKFNVVGAEEATDEEIETLWLRLAKDPSIGKDYPYLPTIFKDYTYMLADYRTRLYRSEMPFPARWAEVIHYSDGLNREGSKPFSTRLWMVEKVVTPNLERLGLPVTEITRHAYGDEEGRIKAAEFTRFLGWLVGQRFMGHLPVRLEEFKEKNDVKIPTLTNIAQQAILEVLDTKDNLKSDAAEYQKQFQLEPRAAQHYVEMQLAMEGIYNLCDMLLMGVPKQK